MKKTNYKQILPGIVFFSVLATIFILNLIIAPPEILADERRVPASFPDVSAQDILTGSFSNSFDAWTADNFAFRDMFRAIHSFFVLDIFKQNDNSGLYRSADVGLGRFKYIHYDTFEEVSQKILRTTGLFNDLDMNLYYSIIPDKSEYAEMFLPGFFVYEAEPVLTEALADFEYIRITESLNAGSFYKTDLHWDQSLITDTAYLLLSEMGAEPVSGNKSMAIAGEFSGVYAGEYARTVDPDIMTYFDVQDLTVSYLSETTLEMAEGLLYDPERFAGVDPYDFYLKGPQPIVMIENSNAPERELYIFRDSFGSSLAPLLTDSYSKITLIDLRYIHISMLERYIDFTPGSDVLFIYSSIILGNPDALQA